MSSSRRARAALLTRLTARSARSASSAAAVCHASDVGSGSGAALGVPAQEADLELGRLGGVELADRGRVAQPGEQAAQVGGRGAAAHLVEVDQGHAVPVEERVAGVAVAVQDDVRCRGRLRRPEPARRVARRAAATSGRARPTMPAQCCDPVRAQPAERRAARRWRGCRAAGPRRRRGRACARARSSPDSAFQRRPGIASMTSSPRASDQARQSGAETGSAVRAQLAGHLVVALGQPRRAATACGPYALA